MFRYTLTKQLQSYTFVVEIGFIFGNQGFLTFYSDSWALISCRTGIYPTIYVLNTLKIPIRYITVCRTSSIIPCRNTSCNILRICFNGSKITICLINDQINDKRKMSILSKDTLLESGKLFKKNFQSRGLDTCAAS